MIVSEASDIQQFLTLKSKKDYELRAICDGLGLDNSGTKDEIVDRLLAAKREDPSKTAKPQIIPLATQGAQDKDLAIKALRRLRKLIFDANQRKEFEITTNNGKLYKQVMPYITITTDQAMAIFKHNWFMVNDSQSSLIDLIRKEPTNFIFHVVRRTDNKKNTWMMLHVTKKVA